MYGGDAALPNYFDHLLCIAPEGSHIKTHNNKNTPQIQLQRIRKQHKHVSLNTIDEEK